MIYHKDFFQIFYTNDKGDFYFDEIPKNIVNDNKNYCRWNAENKIKDIKIENRNVLLY